MTIEYYPSAVSVDSLDEWADGLSLQDVQHTRHRIHEVTRLSLFTPTEDGLRTIWQHIPTLKECLDIALIEARPAGAAEHPDHGTFGLALIKMVPELREVHAACVASVVHRDLTTLERAESWLLPIATEIGADADLEATTYFASRGRPVATGEELARIWTGIILRKAERRLSYNPKGSGPVPRIPTTLEEIASVAESWERDFLSRTHGEEHFVEATFVRAVEWHDVEGFDVWVRDALATLSDGPESDVDSYAAWHLFHYTTSDLALRTAELGGLHAWLWKLLRKGTGARFPWHSWRRDRSPAPADYLPTAAILLFARARIDPTRQSDLVEPALALLRESQRLDGGWPLYADDPEGNIVSTAVAVHALAMLGRPDDSGALIAAARWLKAKQDPLGYWHQPGGATVMATVLTLDALSLAEGGPTSFDRFAVPPTGSQEAEQDADPIYDPSGQYWHMVEMPECRSVSREALDERVALLVMVATETELKQVLKVMRPRFRKRKMEKAFVSTETFYVGRLGVHSAAVARCTMGTTGPGAATLATQSGISTFRPRAVIMPGIAFAMTRKYGPADVLIADSIIPYEPQRVGAKRVPRGIQTPSSPFLLDRIKAPSWNFSRPDGSVSRYFSGPVLSGEKLVDSLEFRAQLAKLYPAAIGGEMEGAGVAAAASKARLPWLLAKGVCDWGDGKKHDLYQEMAAASSVALVQTLMEDEHALRGLPNYTDDR